LRNETEWVETLNGGCNFLVDLNYEKVDKILCSDLKADFKENMFGDGSASTKIVQLIIRDNFG